MDNDRHTLEHRTTPRRISIIGAGHVAGLIDTLNELFTDEERGMVMTLECPYSPPDYLASCHDRPRRRSRGGGDYDARGRRRS